MSRQFKTIDYEATLDTSVRLGDCLPQEHLARFIADIIPQLDLSALYARYGNRGGQPYAPEILLGLLFYAYATGVFSSRKIEQGTRQTAAFRFLAGNLSPDHDTIAVFRKTFLPQLQGLFVQILLLAQQMEVFQLGNIILDGTKIHADASKSKAVSHKRLLEIEARLQSEVAQLFALAQQAEYETKMRERRVQEERTGKKPRGKAPTPPTPGPQEGDQYNFTDPDSRRMKNSPDEGFNQHYNAQAAVDQEALLGVGFSLSNHPNDQGEVAPTLTSIPPEIGTPHAAALDTGYFSEANLNLLQAADIDAYIATGRDPHNSGWQTYFASAGPPPPERASLREKMAYKLRTALGKAIYPRRKCTVQPVIGQIKEVLGFRQFSLRGLPAVSGEGCLVCLVFNLRRIHVLTQA